MKRFIDLIYLTTFAALLILPPVAVAHPGGTDANGCHTNRATGQRHCHGQSNTPSQSKAVTVVSVGDGDTIRANQGGQTVTVRLACIDAPEMGQQPYGQNSKARLQTLLPVGTSITLRTIDTDRYGRTVAEIFSGTTNVNLAMVQGGYAVAYRQYLSNCDGPQYLRAESQAQQQRLNFWSQANPIMPWDFRRSRR